MKKHKKKQNNKTITVAIPKNNKCKKSNADKD